MDPTQTHPLLVDPIAFATWVHKVAAINETFSEVIRDTADLIAMHDAAAARGLYQAADTASQTVYQLRMSIPLPTPPLPVPEPAKPPAPLLTLRSRGWFSFGVLCGLLAHVIARL